MKGVLLAGGSGTRLRPLTLGTNKHLLPVGDKPMILHPLEKLVEAGIHKILLVTGPEHLGQFAHLLGDGGQWGCQIHFRVQEKAGGIAEALGLAKGFVGEDSFFVILGDNIFEDSLLSMKEAFSLKKEEAFNVLKEVSDPERFGIAEVKEGKIIDIVEKPSKPVSHLCVTGIYAYTHKVFEIIREIKPSGRGELEISDVNKIFAQAGRLKHHVLKGWWTDAGTLQSIATAHRLIEEERIS